MLRTERISSGSARWIAPVIALLALVGFSFWAWNGWRTAGVSSSPATVSSTGSALTRTNTGGQVTIEATWQGPDAGPTFTITMNTHSVDLEGYDLRQHAVLRTDQGLEVQAMSWNAPSGGHHRSGTLAFPATSADGTPLIDANTHTIELIIRDVAGVPERSFQWTR
jgi:hypothetical protein